MKLQLRGCVQCPNALPDCPACPSNQQCQVQINTCTECAKAICISNGSLKKSGPNSGAIAGGVVGAFFVLAIVAAVIWYRKRQQQSTLLARKRATAEIKADVVARAETVLNRPDPIEKPAPPKQEELTIHISHSDSPNPTLGPAVENPFSDQASINTASDRATNVIPIAYVPPSSASALTAITDATDFTSKTPSSVAASTITPPARPTSTQSGPIRPLRGPEIEDMRLNISRPVSEAPSDLSSLAPPKAPYAPSSVSGVSNRTSIISTTSSFLNEAPQIVTPLQANFRQVLGVQKAEVVQLTAPSSPGLTVSTARSSKATQATSIRSPLGRSAFTADDVEEENEGETDPFADAAHVRPLSIKSTSTFGSPLNTPSGWGGEDSRPNSIMSNNGTIIANIGNATRVQLLKPPLARVSTSTTNSEATSMVSSSPDASPTTTPRSTDFRTAGQLSPPAQGVPRSFDDDASRRISQSTIATSHRTSTADSILEAFPFVPPSPISMHHTSQPSTPSAQRGFAAQQEQSDPSRLTAPSRYTLGMSVMSSVSASSNGLGGYSFQFGPGSGLESPALPPSPPSNEATNDRASRASLDTLALSRDLQAFPLSYEDSPSTPRSSAPFVPK